MIRCKSSISAVSSTCFLSETVIPFHEFWFQKYYHFEGSKIITTWFQSTIGSVYAARSGWAIGFGRTATRILPFRGRTVACPASRARFPKRRTTRYSSLSTFCSYRIYRNLPFRSIPHGLRASQAFWLLCPYSYCSLSRGCSWRRANRPDHYRPIRRTRYSRITVVRALIDYEPGLDTVSQITVLIDFILQARGVDSDRLRLINAEHASATAGDELVKRNGSTRKVRFDEKWSTVPLTYRILP